MFLEENIRRDLLAWRSWEVDSSQRGDSGNTDSQLGKQETVGRKQEAVHGKYEVERQETMKQLNKKMFELQVLWTNSLKKHFVIEC